MKVIPKLQQGNTIESDNTKVVRPEIHEPIKAKPKQYSIVDLGGEPGQLLKEIETIGILLRELKPDSRLLCPMRLIL